MSRNLPRFVRRRDGIEKICVGGGGFQLLEVFDHALEIINEVLEDPTYVGGSLGKARVNLQGILSSESISLTRVNFPLPNTKISDMVLNIDMRRNKVTIMSKKQPGKRVMINTLLRGLL